MYLNTHGVEFWTVPTTLTSTVALPAGMNATVDTTDTPPVEIVFADPNNPGATHYSNGTTSATELDDLNGGPLYLASVPSWWPVYSNNLYVDGQHGAFTVNWAPDYSSYTIGGSQADFDKEQDIFNMTGPTHSASGVDWYATLANNAVSEVRGNSYRYIATSTSGSWIVNRDIASSNMPAWNMGPGYLNEILTFTDPGVYTAPADAFVASGWEQDNKRVAFNANESREFSTAEQPSWWPANPSLPGYPLSTGPASEAAWSAAHGGTPYSAEAALAAAIAENPDFVHVDNATGTTYYAYAVNEDVDYCLQNN